MASRFYALMFVAMTGILGMVSSPDLALITSQAQINQDRKAEGDRRINQGTQQYNSNQRSTAEDSGRVRELIRRSTRDADTEGSGLVRSQEQTIQDRKAEADKLFNQGNQQFQISQFEAAFQSWQQALAIYREIKDRFGEGQSLGNLGLVYRNLGKYDKAIGLHLLDLEIAREIKDRRSEGRALGNLGVAYNSLGKYDKVIELQTQRLAITREIKDRLGEGQSLGNLGLA